MIILDSKKQLIVDTISKVVHGKISINNAAKLLDKSRRTIERYVSGYKENGIKFIVHGNTGRTPINKTSDELKHQVQALIKNKYYDLNLQHLSEMLSINEGISIKRETLRTWAHEIHHVKRAKKRRSNVRKRRERMVSSGLMMQMDGSHHRWFGEKTSCLIAMIDDATSDIYAQFFKSETTLGCLEVMQKFIEAYGLFRVLYVDRAGIFGGPKRCNFSQMQRACEELGIQIIFANSPQGKGRIERAFDTLQDRLVPELRLHNIQNISNANKYLQQCFIPNYWNKNIVVKPKNNESEFIPLPSYIDLNDICVIKEYRKIRNDHTFSYGNNFYMIDSPLKHSIAKQEIEIIIDSDNDIKAKFANKELSISKVQEPIKSSIYGAEVQRKLDAIELAEKLGNVAKAARISGCSRETIYKNKRLLAEKGPMALKRTFRTDIHHKNRASKEVEKAVIAFSLENPYLGQAQVSAYFRANNAIDISPSGVRQIWLREQLNTISLRVKQAKSLQERV